MSLPLNSLCCCRVDWQLWTSSSDGCGTSCARQSDFKKAFSATAQQLQQVRGTAARSSMPALLFRAAAACHDTKYRG